MIIGSIDGGESSNQSNIITNGLLHSDPEEKHKLQFKRICKLSIFFTDNILLVDQHSFMFLRIKIIIVFDNFTNLIIQCAVPCPCCPICPEATSQSNPS